MLHADLMNRVSVTEFMYWTAFHANQQQAEKPEQTPEQILATIDMMAWKQKRAN